MRQQLPWGVDDVPSVTVAQYQTIGGNGEVANWTSNENEVRFVVPADGTIKGFSGNATSASGTGKSMSIVVRKNGTDTALALSFADSTQQASSSEEVAVYDGDIITLKSSPTNSPNSSKYSGSIEFEPTTATQTIMMGSSGSTQLNNTTKYYSPFSQGNGTTTYTDVQNVITEKGGGVFGTIKKIRVALVNAPGGSNSRTFTLFKNSVATGLTVTAAAGAVTVSAEYDVEVSDGDTVTLQAVANGSPVATEAAWGFVIEPANENEYLLCGYSRTTLPTSGSTYDYNFINGGNASWNPTKTDRRVGGEANHQMIGLGFKLSRSPSASADNKAYELYLENPSTDTVAPRAYVEGTTTYAKSTIDNWETARYQSWNVRTLGFNSPRTATGAWCVQMKYVG